MERKELKKRVGSLKGEEKNELINYMTKNGFSMEEWNKIEKTDKMAFDKLVDFFENKEVVSDVEPSGNSNVTDIDFEQLKSIAKDMKENEVTNNTPTTDGNLAEKNDKNEDKTKDTTTNKNSTETKSAILKRYKTIDNLVSLIPIQETVIKEVEQLDENTFGCYMTGEEIASMFLHNALVFDPTMQRGVKQDKKGNVRANFRESHITDIYKSMLDGNFTATQMRLALITDDEELQYEYDNESKELFVNGKIRLLDGQHRTRALARIHEELKFDKIDNVDLDKILFNVIIDVATADEARVIYSNIDKNLKLDKSQVRQLSSDVYAKIVNILNQSSESDLRGKIATARPVGDRLVLFSNLAESIEESIKIQSIAQRNEIAQYLIKFFNYLTNKMPKAFGNDVKDRIEFRKNNLLNENNFFQAWMKVAFLDMDNYEKNIDKIVENIEYFNKDNVDENGENRWLKCNAVKHKVKGEGFAMNNTSTGIKGIIDNTLKLIENNEKGV